MNLIDAKVTKILDKPKFVEYRDRSWWVVEIESLDMGGKQIEKMIYKTKEEAEKLKVGDIFQH